MCFAHSVCIGLTLSADPASSIWLLSFFSFARSFIPSREEEVIQPTLLICTRGLLFFSLWLCVYLPISLLRHLPLVFLLLYMTDAGCGERARALIKCLCLFFFFFSFPPFILFGLRRAGLAWLLIDLAIVFSAVLMSLPAHPQPPLFTPCKPPTHFGGKKKESVCWNRRRKVVEDEWRGWKIEPEGGMLLGNLSIFYLLKRVRGGWKE